MGRIGYVLLPLLFFQLNAHALAPQAVKEALPPTSQATFQATPAEQGQQTIVFIGDSLTQGYGVKSEEAYPALIENQLNQHGIKVRVINGGISGSVTADADRRLKWYLRAKPDVVVLALGANDGLKGTAPEVIKKNLLAAIQLAEREKLKVLLCGIQVFTNFGPEYSSSFAAVFSSLAREHHLRYVPFLLEGVALHRELMQADGKHPNAKGHVAVAARLLPEIEKLLGHESSPAAAPAGPPVGKEK